MLNKLRRIIAWFRVPRGERCCRYRIGKRPRYCPYKRPMYCKLMKQELSIVHFGTEKICNLKKGK